MSASDMAARRLRALHMGSGRAHARKQLLFARGLREAPNARPNVRRAHAVAHCLEHYPVILGPDDRLVGALARDNPALHPTLMVRVAGYSDYFSRVGPAQQGDIITRTEYEEAGQLCPPTFRFL